ncbi:MAG: hypothetical protein QF467_00625 [SAR202 cluster bacterium]|jgi:hypothetical protein|nr:hypothetical protein [SAR202 cluster bacterium]|tara:strand:- start:1722 stop:2246 length:525 start_codon:yes stop_codon:yes gene_type:complete
MTRGWLIGGGVFLGALLVAGIVVALMDEEDSLPEGSPEATVQLFLKAVEDGDLEAAYGFLSDSLKGECDVETFVGRSLSQQDRMRDTRVTLERTTTVEHTVFVTVRITQFRSGGPFGSSDSSHEQRFALADEQGQWRFTVHPWPYFGCGPFKIPPTPITPPTPEPTATSTPVSG